MSLYYTVNVTLFTSVFFIFQTFFLICLIWRDVFLSAPSPFIFSVFGFTYALCLRALGLFSQRSWMVWPLCLPCEYFTVMLRCFLLTFQTIPWLEGWGSRPRCDRLIHCMTNCQFPFVLFFLSNTLLLFLFVGDTVAKTHSGIRKDLQVSLWSPVCCIHCRSRYGCSSPPGRR